MTAKDVFLNLLQDTDININGENPWDIKVNNENLYGRILKQGSLGLGESYMEKWWDCDSLDHLIDKILRANLDQKIKKSIKHIYQIMVFRLFNFQTGRNAYEVAHRHYDLGNELYTAMLDSTMMYSCAYWENARDLHQAQLNKLDLIAKKLQLAPGMRLLDIGCGWGGMAKYAAEKYGVEVVAVTISEQQMKYAEQQCGDLPIQFILEDYRNIKGQFDRIVSIGMFEHVGYKNYHSYMKVAYDCLKDDGLFLLHTIGNNITEYTTEPFIQKYIFPNGMLPSIKQMGAAIEDYFVMEDWHNLSVNYDKTLLAWCENFEKNWPSIKHLYDERFYRMWRYYLLASAGGFRARWIQVWQIVLSKQGLAGGYQSIR